MHLTTLLGIAYFFSYSFSVAWTEQTRSQSKLKDVGEQGEENEHQEEEGEEKLNK